MPDGAKIECFVSAVAPISNDADIVEGFVRDLVGVLATCYSNYEVVLIDDGSTDGTAQVVKGLLQETSGLRLLRLSRRFGQEIAISAGLESAIGDFVVVILPEYDPPDLVPEMVRRAREGAACVFGIRTDRMRLPWWHRFGADVFYRYCDKFLGLKMPPGVTHFRVMSRQIVNAVTQIKDHQRFLRTLSAYVGYSNQGMLYAPRPRRSAMRRKSLGECVELAINIVVANSLHPLRIVGFLALLASASNLVYILYVSLVFLMKRDVMAGWTTQSLQNSVMFALMFLVLAVLSRYLGRLLDEARHRPLYYLLEEHQSNVLLIDVHRENVATESVAPDA